MSRIDKGREVGQNRCMKWCGLFSFLLLGLFFLFLLLRSSEDTFIKDQSGKWVKHGNPSFEAARDLAISEAKKLFQEKKKEGRDFSQGPCLSNEIIPDWVADIAHNPREEFDDDPANQCSAFKEGKAHHFVELDLEGNVVRTY